MWDRGDPKGIPASFRDPGPAWIPAGDPAAPRSHRDFHGKEGKFSRAGEKLGMGSRLFQSLGIRGGSNSDPGWAGEFQEFQRQPGSAFPALNDLGIINQGQLTLSSPACLQLPENPGKRRNSRITRGLERSQHWEGESGRGNPQGSPGRSQISSSQHSRSRIRPKFPVGFWECQDPSLLWEQRTQGMDSHWEKGEAPGKPLESQKEGFEGVELIFSALRGVNIPDFSSLMPVEFLGMAGMG